MFWQLRDTRELNTNNEQFVFSNNTSWDSTTLNASKSLTFHLQCDSHESARRSWLLFSYCINQTPPSPPTIYHPPFSHLHRQCRCTTCIAHACVNDKGGKSGQSGTLSHCSCRYGFIFSVRYWCAVCFCVCVCVFERLKMKEDMLKSLTVGQSRDTLVKAQQVKRRTCLRNFL